MTSPRKYHLAFGLACICSCALLAAEDPNLKAPLLQFEESPVDLVLHTTVALYAQNAGQKITYAAGIVRKPGTMFLNWGVTGTPGFQDYVMRQGFSEGQKQFLTVARRKSNDFGEKNSVVRLDLDVQHAGRSQLLLYAVSLEDARKMAQGYIDCMTKVYKASVKLSQDNRQDLLWKLSASRKRIAEVDEAFKTSPSDLETFIRTVPYRSEKEAADAIGELNKTLNAAMVEIAGIQARFKAILRDQSSPGTPQAVRPNLELMFIEESIALQAAEARKRTATDLRNQAKRFVDLTQGPVEKRKLLDEVQQYEDFLQTVDRELASPKPPEIVDNKVFLYRVKQPE